MTLVIVFYLLVGHVVGIILIDSVIGQVHIQISFVVF